MTTLHYLDGPCESRTIEDLDGVRAALAARLPSLAEMPLEATIAILALLAREIPRDPRLASTEGAAYLALWLKRSNLERLCRLDYLADHRHERFAPIRPGVEMRAYPRGLVGHWVAGNMPTLAVFSLALAMLSRNASVIKVPEPALATLLALLDRLSALEVQVGDVVYRGADLARGVALIGFAGSEDHAASAAMARIVDVKLVWGDAEAVRSVTALPQQEHCEILSFGPKYAFGVLDREAIASERLDEILSAAARDIAAFSQRACSSPHVLFFERGALPLGEIATRLEAAFAGLPARTLATVPDPRTASRIIEERAAHLLDPALDARVPADLSWSILVGGSPRLEQPIGGRTVWLKEVDSLATAAACVTRRIQVVGIAIDDEAGRRQFAEQATARGADRIVAFGRMHDFDLPWDGALALNRLVRWVVLAP